MSPVQPTTSITIDDVTLDVSELSQGAQQLLATYDDWRNEEVEAQSKLLMVKAALRDLQREIYAVIVADRDAAASEAGEAPETAE